MNKSELSKRLYELKLMETISAKELEMPGFGILRVPGGWLFFGSGGGAFVPFDNEFANGNKPIKISATGLKKAIKKSKK